MGIYLLVYQALFLGEGISRQGAITFIIPGVALTVITQIHWTFVQKPKISRNLGSMVTTQHEEEDSGKRDTIQR